MADGRKAAPDLDLATPLAGLVDYQPGAVVSRTILKRTAGTVTAFAFAEGEGLSEHTAAFDALVYLVEGAAEIMVGGTPQRVSAGDILRLPAGIPHALKALSRFKMLLVMIRE
jgi:quercetin dioxygenase-like cupin family protein